MTNVSRRDFAKLVGGAGAGILTVSALGPIAIAQSPAKVVVVGGGAGGATVANHLKKGDPKLDVTLVEANRLYSSSFFSNLYVGGFRNFASLNHGYRGLADAGVKVVFAT